MTRKNGKTYEQVTAILQTKGMRTDKLEIATLTRGPFHLILMDGETIGEYNHLTGQISLYTELEQEV